MKYKLKLKIFYKLAELRDHDWMPKLIVDLIDWVRYEWFFESNFE